MSVFPRMSHPLLPAVIKQPVAKKLRENREVFSSPSVPLTSFHKMEARNTVSYEHERLARKHLSTLKCTVLGEK